MQQHIKKYVKCISKLYCTKYNDSVHVLKILYRYLTDIVQISRRRYLQLLIFGFCWLSKRQAIEEYVYWRFRFGLFCLFGWSFTSHSRIFDSRRLVSPKLCKQWKKTYKVRQSRYNLIFHGKKFGISRNEDVKTSTRIYCLFLWHLIICFGFNF